MMKKSNILTLLSLVLMIAAVVLFMTFRHDEPTDDDIADNTVGVTTESSADSEISADTEDATSSETLKDGSEIVTEPLESEDTAESETPSEPAVPTEPATPTEPAPTEPKPNVDFSMNGSLFIGDSRTVGLMEYSGIEGADYFCTVGMTVYNIHEKPVSVPNVGKLTLTELLGKKKYDKIYVMLGINELGYNVDSTVQKYGELVDLIKSCQSDATVFIQANLHVTKKRSDGDGVINNAAINSLNSRLSKLADGKSKFYIDANVLFDDKNGALSADKSNDSAHVLAKYYREWGEWIRQSSASLLGGEKN